MEQTFKDINNQGTRTIEIEDNGHGIKPKAFTKLLLSFGYTYQEKMEKDKAGVGFKSSVFRLGHSVFIVSKSEKHLCIGLVSKRLMAQSNSSKVLH